MALSTIAAPSYRIVIADDDVDTVESTALWLQMNGHETRQAFDGVQVLRQAETFHPHFIFLDVAMPEMDGYTVTSGL
jgi:two-component system, chemotaxis family, CheB/CheR fusion protein